MIDTIHFIALWIFAITIIPLGINLIWKDNSTEKEIVIRLTIAILAFTVFCFT